MAEAMKEYGPIQNLYKQGFVGDKSCNMVDFATQRLQKWLFFNWMGFCTFALVTKKKEQYKPKQESLPLWI